MIIRKKIKETEHFKSMDSVLRNIYLKKSVVERIRLGVSISKAQGYDQWTKMTSANENVRAIVKEIIDEDL